AAIHEDVDRGLALRGLEQRERAVDRIADIVLALVLELDRARWAARRARAGAAARPLLALHLAATTATAAHAKAARLLLRLARRAGVRLVPRAERLESHVDDVELTAEVGLDILQARHLRRGQLEIARALDEIRDRVLGLGGRRG